MHSLTLPLTTTVCLDSLGAFLTCILVLPAPELLERFDWSSREQRYYTPTFQLYHQACLHLIVGVFHNNHQQSFMKQGKVNCCCYHHHNHILAIAGVRTSAAIVTPIQGQTEFLNTSGGDPCGTNKEEE
jgi:hypothetical protein